MWRSTVPPRVLVLTVAASAGAGLGIGALSACSAGAQAPGTVPAAATAPAFATTSSPATPPAGSGPVTADQASAIAVQTSPGSVTEVEQEIEASGPVFDVTIQHPDGTEIKVEVDANTGQVLSTETDGQDGQDDQNEPPGDSQ